MGKVERMWLTVVVGEMEEVEWVPGTRGEEEMDQTAEMIAGEPDMRVTLEQKQTAMWRW